VTVVTSAVVVWSPTVLAHLQRTPAGLHGEWWRTLTSVGYAWQPSGAGNSVAVCGLAGVIALACWRRDSRLPAFGTFALLWCAVILPSWAWPAAVVGAVCAMAGVRLQAEGWRYGGEFAVGVTLARYVPGLRAEHPRRCATGRV
jgi:hypothetical protein